MVKKVNKLNIPKWCKSYHTGDNLYDCCKCKRNFGIKYQCGDGKRIHSLCETCYLELEEGKAK